MSPVSSHCLIFMMLKGQAGPGSFVMLLCLCIPSDKRGFKLVGLCLNRVWDSCFHSDFPGKMSACLACRALPAFQQWFLCSAVTFALIFSPSRQAGRKTHLRHLTLWHDHAGLIALPWCLWPPVCIYGLICSYFSHIISWTDSSWSLVCFV